MAFLIHPFNALTPVIDFPWSTHSLPFYQNTLSPKLEGTCSTGILRGLCRGPIGWRAYGNHSLNDVKTDSLSARNMPYETGQDRAY